MKSVSLAVSALSLFLILVASAQAQTAAPAPQSRGARTVERMCAAPAKGRAWSRYAERLSQRLALDDRQKALLKDWQEVRLAARDQSRATLCSPKPDLTTFGGRLDWRQKRLESQLAQLKATRPKLEAFYNALSDQQRASWDEIRAQSAERRARRRAQRD